MKQGVSLDIRQRVLDLRRSYSQREVAERTGLPIGTVKTICSRSGAFRDNPKHHALFSLPPIRQSTQTALTVPELPPQQRITGDDEIDAVLWLSEVIGTGQSVLIEKAMLAAKKIKTPLKELEKRYTKHLVSMNPGNLFAALSSFDFADLDRLAEKSVQKAARKKEATDRFGDAIFSDTEAESFCIGALAGLKCGGIMDCFNDDEVAQRFRARPEVMPNTLSDCLHELAFWRELYCLRYATGGFGDPAPEASAHDDMVFRMLAQIRPRNKEESVAVFRYLAENECMDRPETNDILLNLIC